MSDEWTPAYRLQKARERQHVLSAIVRATGAWAEVLAVIAESADAEAARSALRDRFGVDEVQATVLLDIQFRRVSALDRQRLSDELAQIEAEIARLEAEV
ncbi:MAG TPA: DNA gyrase subunit A [Mycobacteriales bacterium]|nr:DNA gyrase subunit A [Mycobacteriales bacterium]